VSEPEVHLLWHGWTLCGRFWPDLVAQNAILRWVHELRWVSLAEEEPGHRDAVTCTQCLVWAGQYHAETYGWHPIVMGPYTWGACCFCGKYGDESTMEPLSGDQEGCFECVDGALRENARVIALEVPEMGIPDVHLGSTLESLFDELGEREEFDALVEKKLDPSSVCDHCPPHEVSPATREECARGWPFLCETVDRNWTQLRIEHLHPAQQLAWTAECDPLLVGLTPERRALALSLIDADGWPHPCTPRRGHCFEFDARGFEHQ